MPTTSTRISVDGLNPADATYRQGTTEGWLDVDLGGGGGMAIYGDAADLACCLAWWIGLLLEGCDNEGLGQIHRSLAGLEAELIRRRRQEFPERLRAEVTS